MSLGFLMDADTPVIWRGPMIKKALQQFLEDVEWGKLDYLIVDLPPGTGDAQLTLTQQVPLSGAVIVTTPQDVALIDARKGLSMFQKVNVPLLGVIENMSGYECPKCGHLEAIFKAGGRRKTAEQLGVPFLGDVPLDPPSSPAATTARRSSPPSPTRPRRRRSWLWPWRSSAESRSRETESRSTGDRPRTTGHGPRQLRQGLRRGR